MYMYMYECICYMYMYVLHKCVLGCCGTTTKHTVEHVVPIPYHPGFSSSQHFVRLFSPLFLSSFFFQEGHTVMYILYMYMVMYNVYICLLHPKCYVYILHFCYFSLLGGMLCSSGGTSTESLWLGHSISTHI